MGEFKLIAFRNDGATQKVLDNRLHFPVFAVYTNLAILGQFHDVSVSH